MTIARVRRAFGVERARSGRRARRIRYKKNATTTGLLADAEILILTGADSVGARALDQIRKVGTFSLTIRPVGKNR